MKPFAKVAIAVGLLIAAGMYYDLSTAPSMRAAPPATQRADPLPDVTFRRANQRLTRWGDIATPSIVLNFWASWCAPCKEEFPLLAEAAANHPDTLTLITVSVDETDADMRRFLAALDPETRQRLQAANVLMVRDESSTIARAFEAYRYPETYVIGPERTVERKIIGLVRPGDLRFAK